MTERFTGHGAEWRDANLSAGEAKIATSWVEMKVDKRSMLTQKDRVKDVRDAMWQLEKEGEIVVHRIDDGHAPVMVKTLYGWDKKIPTQRLWHHKSCGQCGNIPGYPASLLWLMNRMEVEYLDETDQTSCTAWNYHGSGIGNLESLAAVFLRNFHQAYVAAKAQGLPEAYYYPLVHCGTSFGNYKEVRNYLMHSAKLRESVKKILGKLGRLVDGKLLIPEEIVHYSEWLHVMRDRIASMREVDCSGIRATIHPACHVYKMVPEDAIYDDTIMGGNRLAVSTGLMQTLGAQVIDYSTWYDCCGFGFRHIISEREFTRSFAIDRKILIRSSRLAPRHTPVHHRPQLATVEMRQHVAHESLHQLGPLLRTAAPHRGAHHGEPLAQHPSQVDPVGHPTGEGAEHHQATAMPKQRQVGVEILGAQRVDDHMHRTTDLAHPVGVGSKDSVLHPQFTRTRNLVGSA
jgi:heterodisulfide reductase subunit B